MASVIFRRYWIDGDRTHAAIVGDISLDSVWRGRGLGQLLLRFMTDYLEDHFPEHPAFVIPTEAARRSFAEIGWTTPGKLIPYVYLLDPTRYVRPVVRSEAVATAIVTRTRDVARRLARRLVRDGNSLQILDNPDDPALVAFLRELPKLKGSALHDFGPRFLTWRYAQHPRIRFRIAKLVRNREVLAFLVFEQDADARSCLVFDLVAATPPDLLCMLALFILRALSEPGLTTVRVLLDSLHPDRASLRRLGFVPRRSESVFQVHSLSGIAERVSWRVTLGDKDT